jgi:cation diffusion facilitator CzcD-associated flavoprotein CzcO
MSEPQNQFDVIVIGAGISGVSAAYHLQKYCPDQRFVILEARDAMGGTWDLFRYPGIRSDSDMFTLGYGFRPWPNARAIADGPSIKKYVEDTANEYGITDKIRFGKTVTAMTWSTAGGCWELRVESDEGVDTYRCKFVLSCAGYYRYSSGHRPQFPGEENFSGDIIHPQHWPENYDYAGKRIVVIGSGATAVTLAPALADKAAHVTMLQRSPSYYFSMPGESGFAKFLYRILPGRAAHALMRWQRVVMQQFFFKFARAYPARTAKNLIKFIKDRLPEGYDVKRHFTPRYNPWGQRLCVVPDDDLFDAIGNGTASVVTDTIKEFTNDGILLNSGETINADVIVTATGLTLQAFGGADLFVDDQKIEPGEILTYKGAMFEGVPNFMAVFGYTNASWTLRADLVNAYACRLITYLNENEYASVTPENADPLMGREAFLDFSSGYVTRAAARLPKQGDHAPWRHPQDYFRDIKSLRYDRLDDGVLRYVKADELAKNSAATA